MTDDTTSQAVPVETEGSQEAASAGDATQEARKSISEILGEALGKKFGSDDAALKSVKDTFSFVGKAGSYQKSMQTLTSRLGLDEQGVLQKLESLSMDNEQATQATQATDSTSEIQQLKATVEEMTFFAERPELKDHKDLLREIRGTSGKSYAEVVEMPAFKSMLEKARTAEEMERQQSVLKTNPRLGQVRDKLSEAKQAAEAGNDALARKSAVGAVLDAFEG